MKPGALVLGLGPFVYLVLPETANTWLVVVAGGGGGCFWIFCLKVGHVHA